MATILDQHFLEDKEVLKEIIAAAELSKEDLVLEIGAGKGVLTKELAKHCKKVIAIEIDEHLKQELGSLPKKVEIIFGNALELMGAFSFNKIVSNIPYSLSEPLLKRLLKLKLELAVLLVGKDFYELLTEKESKWKIIVPLFYELEKICDVLRSSFVPPPRTDSVVLKFKIRTKALSTKEGILKEIILQDDKKLRNALMFALVRVKGLTKNQAREEIAKIKLAQEWWDKRVMDLSGVQFGVVVKEIVG
ncbi:MAG: rRNA adenine N-6-methyltransferase family protein [Nanoarchaeota archaeon]